MNNIVSFTNNEPSIRELPVMSEEEYKLVYWTSDEIDNFRHEAVLEMMGVVVRPTSTSDDGDNNNNNKNDDTTTTAASPKFGTYITRKRPSARRRGRKKNQDIDNNVNKNNGCKTDTQILAELAASPMYRDATLSAALDPAAAEAAAEEAQSSSSSSSCNMPMNAARGSRPSIGERQPSVRERRDSDSRQQQQRRRRSRDAETIECSLINPTDCTTQEAGSSSSGSGATGRTKTSESPRPRTPRSGGRAVRSTVSRDTSVIIASLPPAPIV